MMHNVAWRPVECGFIQHVGATTFHTGSQNVVAPLVGARSVRLGAEVREAAYRAKQIFGMCIYL